MFNAYLIAMTFSPRGALGRFLAFLDRRFEGLLLILVLILGTGGIALGAVGIKRSVHAPFIWTGEVASNKSAPAVNIDTDADGLTDNQELAVYGTSPYLVDSDSDGASDGDEVRRGTDPNCPEGKDCAAELSNQLSAPTLSLPSLGAGALGTGANNVTAAEVREMLRAAGVPENELSSLSDEELLTAYQKGLRGELGTESDNSSTAPATPPVADLKALSAAEVRELLLKSGVPADKISNVPDDELMRIYQATLEELPAPEIKQ